MRVEEVLGANLKSRREALDLTQEEVAQRVGALLGKSWTRQNVYLAERGDRSFTAAEILAFAETLDTGVRLLFQLPLGADSIELPGGPIDRLRIVGAEDPAEGWDPTAFIRSVRDFATVMSRSENEQADAAQRTAAYLTTVAEVNKKRNDAVRKLWDVLNEVERVATTADREDES